MQKISLILLVSFYLIIKSYARNPCKGPLQWKAKTYDRDNKAKLKSEFEVTYDSLKKRTRKVGYEKIGNYSDNVDVIQLLNEKIEYRYSFTKKECQKNVLIQEWTDFEIPKNASFYGDLTIGASNLKDANLLVSSWGANVNLNGQNFDLLAIYTINNCVPVSIYLDNIEHDYELHFFNVSTSGISDSDFTLPEKCLSLQK